LSWPQGKNHSGEEPTVGRIGEYKYDGKFFEGEILALLGKSIVQEVINPHMNFYLQVH